MTRLKEKNKTRNNSDNGYLSSSSVDVDYYVGYLYSTKFYVINSKS